MLDLTAINLKFSNHIFTYSGNVQGSRVFFCVKYADHLVCYHNILNTKVSDVCAHIICPKPGHPYLVLIVGVIYHTSLSYINHNVSCSNIMLPDVMYASIPALASHLYLLPRPHIACLAQGKCNPSWITGTVHLSRGFSCITWYYVVVCKTIVQPCATRQ